MGKGKEVLYSESRGVFSNTRNYLVNVEEPKKLVIAESSGFGENSGALLGRKFIQGNESKGRWIQNFRLALSQIFLPYGYPDSVSADYINFQIWDTIQVN